MHHYIVLLHYTFQVHTSGCPVIIVGTHLDQVNIKSTGGLKKLVDQLYNDTSIYPMIATVAFLSNVPQKLTRNSDLSKLRKGVYYVATHLFLIRNKGNTITLEEFVC